MVAQKARQNHTLIVIHTSTHVLILEFVWRRRRRGFFINNHFYHFYEFVIFQSDIYFSARDLQLSTALRQNGERSRSSDPVRTVLFEWSVERIPPRKISPKMQNNRSPFKPSSSWLPLSGHPFIKNNYADTKWSARFWLNALDHRPSHTGWISFFSEIILQLISFKWRDLPNKSFVPLMSERCSKKRRQD